MKISGPFKLRSTEDDQSNAIVQTFSDKWRKPLIEGHVRVVFRKNGPRQFTPTMMYAYVAGPTSAIVAKMAITSYTTMSINEAVKLASSGAITEAELRDYAESYSQLVVMPVDLPRIARSPITYKFLSAEYNYWPSSTFIPLSQHGVQILDKLGEFHALETGS